jgi:iron complex transport system substrate-binding protein
MTGIALLSRVFHVFFHRHYVIMHVARTISMQEADMRIVSLLASATEMVAALGCLGQLVGRSHECDYPPEVHSLPVVSRVQIDIAASSSEIDAQIKQLAQALQPQDAAMRALSIYAIDVEMLQALRPDVIFTQTQCEVCAVSEQDVMRAVEHLTGFQPRIVSLAPHRLEDVWEDILRVGDALDRRARAARLVQHYKARLAHLAQQVSSEGQRPGVAVLEWLDPLMASGNWMPELIEAAGGTSSFGEIGQHSPWLSWEELQAANPDVLVLSPCGFTVERTMQDVPILQRHPVWKSLRAVQQGRVYAIDGNAYLHRSGPRLVESAALLARVIHGVSPGIQVEGSAWISVR